MTAPIPTLREVLDRGDDPADVLPVGGLVEMMLEVGQTVVMGDVAVCAAAVAALLDLAGEEPAGSPYRTQALWALELIDEPDLMRRLAHSSVVLLQAFVAALRELLTESSND